MGNDTEKAPTAEAIGNDLSAGGGLRFNAGKNRMELVPPEWEYALADVTTQGSHKYEARNWERGMTHSTMVGCAKRHVAKYLAGERYDGPEFNLEAGTTGCHHLAMAAWNLLALMSYDIRGVGVNDLPELGMDVLQAVNGISRVLPVAIVDPHPLFVVTLVDHADGKKINMIKEVRYATKMGLKDAKRFVESLPAAVCTATVDVAHNVATALTEAGGTVKLERL